MADNCLSNGQISSADNEKLVRPKLPLQTLLQQAGAEKDVFTMKEVMFYLGKYIMRKQLYDQQQQHIVRCGGDELGAVLGVDTFSVKEPRVLFAMITKNLTAVKNPDTTETQSSLLQPGSQSEPEGRAEDSESNATTSSRRRRRSSDPAESSTEDETRERRKRHKSDSLSLTFDDSLSWCVIGGLRGIRRSSESSDSHSNTEVGISVSDDSDESLGEDSDSDNFSVEFEVESIDSDAYSENDEASVAGEDEVYEVTIFGAEDEDSFDEDTEITEADYWKCPKCDELNPPLPRNCNRCWTLRTDWLPENETDNAAATTPADTPAESASDAKPLPPKPTLMDSEEGLDVPDGKRALSGSPPAKEDPSAVTASLPDSQTSACSQPSTSSAVSGSVSSSQDEVLPELERFNSLDACLPASCLEPCVICQSRPKNGCIVHGRTGHLMACYTCAKKLKNRNKLCPVCREPIQSVVLTYVS
ncbi:E3 ubiquitin-protein ligase Mdm2 isoform X2 [Clupea harengus]|uniref:E3 ubiquitin-protein ligase Mdm2 n=1 Tax=Clupea harengus TaxID=7950 RepID=A0A6P3VKW8_CLUHA|nr:E3 ubiquitin-protein ligase Mdm2 isoform X2 [Clupea harengus]